MNYPLISEYIEAIRSAEDNFDKLSNLRPVLDNNGNPIMSSGNFAVVFKMQDIDTGRFFAVKCFIKEQEGRDERYAKITEELQYVYSLYILHVRYLNSELYVDTTVGSTKEFPVLLMDWIDGQPLDAYLREHIQDEYARLMLAYRFCNMGAWLMSQSFAHGDLKPDNILVREDGSLVLVDYDGMFVPSMKGERAYEIGSLDFRHPNRTADDFDEHIDDFSIATIALSLKAIALNPSLYSQYTSPDRLLFSANDYLDISQTSVLQSVMALTSNKELAIILSLFLLAISKGDLSMISFRLLILKEPERNTENLLCSKITDDERREAIIDDYLVEYTKDWSKLIYVPKDISKYIVNERCKVIADGAFRECKNMKSISLPIGLQKIGKNAFTDCCSLQSIVIPEGVKYIGSNAFAACHSLITINIPDSVIKIGQSAFNGCRSLEGLIIEGSSFYVINKMLISSEGVLISSWTNQIDITIPKEVKKIGDYAFMNCQNLYYVCITDGVKHIGDWAFGVCKSIHTIIVPSTVESIGNHAFFYCVSLHSINIPNGVTYIGMYAFCGCKSIENLIIPRSILSIGCAAFNCCSSLMKLQCENPHYQIKNEMLISSSKKVISCWSISKHIEIPNGVIEIGERAFVFCKLINTVKIPDSVKRVEGFAFGGCESLKYMSIPQGVISIGEWAFSGCVSLQDISINSTNIHIGEDVFRGCSSLKHIYVLQGEKEKYVNLLGENFKAKIFECLLII